MGTSVPPSIGGLCLRQRFPAQIDEAVLDVAAGLPHFLTSSLNSDFLIEVENFSNTKTHSSLCGETDCGF